MSPAHAIQGCLRRVAVDWTRSAKSEGGVSDRRACLACSIPGAEVVPGLSKVVLLVDRGALLLAEAVCCRAGHRGAHDRRLPFWQCKSSRTRVSSILMAKQQNVYTAAAPSMGQCALCHDIIAFLAPESKDLQPNDTSIANVNTYPCRAAIAAEIPAHCNSACMTSQNTPSKHASGRCIRPPRCIAGRDVHAVPSTRSTTAKPRHH